MDKTQRSLREKLAWLGGIIDGEGCFDTGRATTPNYKKRLRNDGKPWWGEYRFARCGLDITNTDGWILDECIAILKELELPYYISRKNRLKPNHRVCYKITVYGYKRLLRVLPQLLPFLCGSKKIQGEFMLKLCELRASKKAHSPWTEEEHRLVGAIRSERQSQKLPQTAMSAPQSTEGEGTVGPLGKPSGISEELSRDDVAPVS